MFTVRRTSKSWCRSPGNARMLRWEESGILAHQRSLPLTADSPAPRIRIHPEVIHACLYIPSLRGSRKVHASPLGVYARGSGSSVLWFAVSATPDVDSAGTTCRIGRRPYHAGVPLPV